MNYDMNYKCTDLISLLPKEYKPESLSWFQKGLACLASNSSKSLCFIGIGALKNLDNIISPQTFDYIQKYCPTIIEPCLPHFCNPKKHNNILSLKCDFIKGLMDSLIKNGDLSKFFEQRYGTKQTPEQLHDSIDLICSVGNIEGYDLLTSILDSLPKEINDIFGDTYENIFKCLCTSRVKQPPFPKNNPFNIDYLIITFTILLIGILATFMLIGVFIGSSKNAKYIGIKSVTIITIFTIIMGILIIINSGNHL